MSKKDDIQEYVNTLLEGTNIQITDTRLSFLIDECIDEVLTYCNRCCLPDKLVRPTAKIVFSYLQSANTQSTDGARISSISEDGRSVNFDLNDIVIDEKNQIYATTLLNRYKKLYRIENDC